MLVVSNTSPILNLCILLRALGQKRIPSLRTEMERLREKAGFYISDHLFDDIIAQSERLKDQVSLKSQS